MQERPVGFLGQKDPLEEEMTLWYSCLMKPTDRDARWAAVCGVAKESAAPERARTVAPRLPRELLLLKMTHSAFQGGQSLNFEFI